MWLNTQKQRLRHTETEATETQKESVAQDTETEAATQRLRQRHTETEATRHRDCGYETQRLRLRDTETKARRHRD